MATDPIDSEITPSEELRFASLVDDLANRLRGGEAIDWEQLQQEYPQWVPKIQQLLPMIGLLSGNTDTIVGEPRRQSAPRVETHFGDYELLRKVGKGGMGEVFEAFDNTLQRRVALKLLSTDLAESDRARIRFENEALAAARLKHPNIVPIYSIGESDGTIYYCMPFIEGVTLSRFRELAKEQLGEVVRNHSHLLQRYFHRIAQVGRDIALALDAAHEAGVIHRDIKPSNVLLEKDGHVWVLDFGLAYLENQKTLTESGEILGTLRYMSPERLTSLDHSRLDRRADIYSIGATIYELLSLQPPFAEFPQSSLYRAITTLSPAPLQKLQPDVPVGLARIVKKAMERDPRDRYQTCQELAEDLGRFLEGHAVAARCTPLSTLSLRYIQSHPIPIAVAAILGAILATSTLAVVNWQRELGLARAANQLQENLLRSREEELRSKELFLSVNQARDRREARSVGWRRENLELLSDSARLAGDPAEKLRVRNEIAASLQKWDLDHSATLLENADVYHCQWSPEGSTLAVGLNLADGDEVSLLLFRGDPLVLAERIHLPSPRAIGADDEGTMGVRSLLFSADGTRLYCGSRSGMLHVVDVASNRVVASRQLDSGSLFALALAPNGEQLAVGSESGILRWCSSVDLEPLHERKFEHRIHRLFWDDENLVVCSGEFYRMTMDQGQWTEPQLLFAGESRVECAASLHAGRGLLMPSYDGLQIVDRATGKVIRTLHFSHGDVESEFSNSSTFSLSASGEVLFSSDRTGITLWDYAKGTPVLHLPLEGGSSNGASEHPTSRQVAIWGENQLRTYRLSERFTFGSSQGKLYPVKAIALTAEGSATPRMHDATTVFSANGVEQTLVSVASTDGSAATEVSLAPTFFDRSADSRDWLVCWSSKRNRLALRHWGSGEARYLREPLQGVTQLTWCEAIDSFLAVAAEKIPERRIGVRSRPLLRMIAVDPPGIAWEWRDLDNPEPEDPANCLGVCARDGRLMALFEDSVFRILDLTTGKEIRSRPLPVKDVRTFCPLSDSQLAIGTSHGSVVVCDWEAQTVLCEPTLHARSVVAIHAMKDGTVVSAGRDGRLVFSKAREGTLQEVARLEFGGGSIEEVAMDPMDSLILLRCQGEHASRWIRVDRLRRYFEELQIDWE